MDSLMSFSGLSHALGARLFPWEGKQGLPSAGGEPRPGPAAGFGFSSVCIDSRAVVPGSLFVALRGEKQDGHSFVDAAFKAGASGAMVSLAALENPAFLLTKAAQKWKGVLIAVEDTLKGLQDAARVYLGQFSNLIRIGITGSTGKTTTKEIAAAIIGQEKSIIMNEGNLNSETGLPLSVFNVNSSHEVGVFEA
ncbi:MAG: Mur ligase domain-containing protein, partial [Treponema sp.]|nr:Mur ligase domain-containing protein [Treponema sp.]